MRMRSRGQCLPNTADPRLVAINKLAKANVPTVLPTRVATTGSRIDTPTGSSEKKHDGTSKELGSDGRIALSGTGESRSASGARGRKCVGTTTWGFAVLSEAGSFHQGFPAHYAPR